MTTPTDDPAAEADDVLLERLRLADPLSGRDPRLDPASLEAVVSELTRTPLDPASQELGITPQKRRRRWLVPALAGAAAASVAALALSGVLGGDPAPTPPTQPGLVLAVQATDPAMSMCMQLSPELLAPSEYAFDATVTALDGGTATLTPSRWYRGERPGTVEVTVPPEVDTALVGAPRFEQGKRYLVAGGDGYLGLCGMSDVWSPGLEAVYRAAFAS